MYGNHIKGTFEVYLKKEVQEEMMKELNLTHNGNVFDFNRFLNQLNNNIPLHISQEAKITTIRSNKKIISKLGVVDEAEKTVLIGIRHLSVGQPRDKTLRKLYLYTDSDVKDIEQLIRLLKKSNSTVAWTTEDNNYKAVDINKIISTK